MRPNAPETDSEAANVTVYACPSLILIIVFFVPERLRFPSSCCFCLSIRNCYLNNTAELQTAFTDLIHTFIDHIIVSCFPMRSDQRSKNAKVEQVFQLLGSLSIVIIGQTGRGGKVTLKAKRDLDQISREPT